MSFAPDSMASPSSALYTAAQIPLSPDEPPSSAELSRLSPAALVLRWWVTYFGMTDKQYTPALDILIDVRPHVLSLYEHEADVSQHTALAPLTVQWATLFDLPPSTGGLDDGIRTVLCSFVMSAWCCLLSLGLQPEVSFLLGIATDSQSVVSCFSLPAGAPPSIHPFTLAPALPLSVIGQLAVYLYRVAREDGYEQGSAAWLQIRQISAFASAISASGSGPAKNSPERVWSSVKRTVAIHIQGRGDDARREAATYIARIVEVVDRIWQARGEPRSAWFCGHWDSVLDIWTDIGRTVSLARWA